MNTEDPLKKREEFAVSLRKKKTKEIILAKRLKREQNISITKTKEQKVANIDKGRAEYSGYDLFSAD